MVYGSAAATADGTLQQKDALMRLSFHEHIECIDSSDMETLWLTLGDELQLGIADELDAYLQENFSFEKHIRSDNVNVTLHDPTQEFRSFLRQRGDQDGGCQFSLELTGDVTFGIDNETSSITLAVKGPEERRSSLDARRTKIYARVMHSIVSDYAHFATAAPPTHPIEETRNLQSACASVIKSAHAFSPDEFMCSPSGPFFFGYGADGDFGIWKGFRKVWSAGSQSDGTTMFLQSDGNLVVRDRSGVAIWESMTGGSATSGGEVQIADNGEVSVLNAVAKKDLKIVPKLVNVEDCVTELNGVARLIPGERVCSQDERFSFGLSLRGDLGIWFGPKQVWSAGTCCQGDGTYAQLQADGNFVVRSGNGDALWKSGTGGPSVAGTVVNVSNTGTVTIANTSDRKNLTIEPSGETTQENSPVRRTSSSDTDIASLIVRDYGIVTITDTEMDDVWRTGEARATNQLPEPAPAPVILRALALDPSLLPCLDPVVGLVVLNEGDFICSPNERFKFGVTPDGDLALFGGSARIWSAGTCCSGETVTATLQDDGNLVVRTSSAKILWTARTSSLDTASLIVGDDGIVTITDTKMGHIWSSAITDENRVVPDSLEAKVMAGYQGWFFAPNDGGINRWVHWSKLLAVPNEDTIQIDAWPDLRELDDDELYPTGFRYNDGSNAGLYSAHNVKTVERHTRWMKDYGVDGVFVQRFIGNAVADNWTPVVDKVLANVRSGAEKYGRTFVTMYDIGNGNEATIVQDVINDWKHLVDDEHITKSTQYLHHRGRPLVAIWGFGFHDRLGTPDQVAEIIDWFKNKAEDRYKVTLMGGIPTGWRDLSRDSKTAAAWASIFRSYDVISPWAVGRFGDIQSANYFRSRYIEPDMAECKSLGIDYLPVVFPGFSFKNLYPDKPFNEIPRNGGTFMWHQMYNAVAAGSKMIYVAMFDEVDEATAIFKVAENFQQTPTEGQFITTSMDQGYSNCPNDWYLKITGMISGLIREGKSVPFNMPAYP